MNGMSGDMINSLSWTISLLLFFMDMCYTLFFYIPCDHVAYHLWACIFSLFSTCLLGLWHTFYGYASFHIFFITPNIDDNMERVVVKQSWSFYFMNGWWMMLIPSVEILHMNMGVYMILITKAWKRILLVSHKLTKLKEITSCIWIWFCNNYSYGSGR